MTNKFKIAFGGKMRSGKDTATKVFIELLGNQAFQHLKFSQGINEILEVYAYKDYPKKPRKELQDIGQSMREILGQDVWVEYTLSQLNPRIHTVISDCRQFNEVQALKEAGFILIYLEADPEVIQERLQEKGEEVDKEQLNHETEDINPEWFDHTLYNNGDYDDLKEHLTYILEEVAVRGYDRQEIDQLRKYNDRGL